MPEFCRRTSAPMSFALGCFLSLSFGCASTPDSSAAGEPPSSPAKTNAKSEPPAPSGTPQTLSITPYENHGHRQVLVRIAGQTVPFLFDTGGGITLVTPAIADAVGCKPFGQLTGFRMRGDRIDFQRCNDVSYHIDDVTFSDRTVGVFDLNKLIPPHWPRLGGLVALSSFAERLIMLDMAGGSVDVSAAPEADAATGTPMNFVMQASGFSIVTLIPSSTSTGKLWLELDSGSDAPLLLSPTAAAALGIDLAGKGVVHHPKVEAGRAESWDVAEVTITLPDVGPVVTSARVIPMIYDGNIGAPLIERFRWTLDMKNARVQISPLAK